MNNAARTAGPHMQQVQQIFSPLSASRKILLIAGVAGFFVSFFPWASTSIGENVPVYNSVTNSGWHGLGVIAVLLFIAAAAWIILPLAGIEVRGVLTSLPASFTEARIVMGAGGIALLCTIIYIFTDNPLGVSVTGISHGPAWGGFLGLIVAAAMVVSGYLMRSEPQSP
jgi:hypothetical protein